MIEIVIECLRKYKRGRCVIEIAKNCLLLQFLFSSANNRWPTVNFCGSISHRFSPVQRPTTRWRFPYLVISLAARCCTYVFVHL